METRRLQAFVTLAELGSYRSAAEVLCITQPALTKQIQSLEQTFGFNLFIRGRHGAVLTEQGALLYSRACELLKGYDDFLNYAYDIQHGSVGELAVGFGLSTFSLVPTWIKDFCESYPQVRFSLKDIPSSVQSGMLLDGRLHIAFLRLPVTPALAYRVIKQERIVLATPMDGQMDVYSALNCYSVLQVNPLREPCLAEQSRIFLSQKNIQASPVTVADDIHTLLALIAGGNGVAFLPESVNNFLPVGVRLIELSDSPAMWNIGIAWNPEFSHPLRDLFLQVMMRKKGIFAL
ncbi:LysR family transcriptional regulator [Citrobacter sp. U14242]|uniref:LysR family transcriptional regulator n=1 Tax=Citrobacter sp. U14242 TaxID=3390192 RepID=UPI003979767F